VPRNNSNVTLRPTTAPYQHECACPGTDRPAAPALPRGRRQKAPTATVGRCVGRGHSVPRLSPNCRRQPSTPVHSRRLDPRESPCLCAFCRRVATLVSPGACLRIPLGCWLLRHCGHLRPQSSGLHEAGATPPRPRPPQPVHPPQPADQPVRIRDAWGRQLPPLRRNAFQARADRRPRNLCGNCAGSACGAIAGRHHSMRLALRCPSQWRWAWRGRNRTPSVRRSPKRPSRSTCAPRPSPPRSRRSPASRSPRTRRCRDR